MHELAIRIVDYLIAKGISANNERDFHIYGCETLLLKVLNVGTLLCIAYVMDNLLEGVVLLLTFMTLRKYTGGFHFKSAFGCYVFTILVYGLSLHLCVCCKWNKVVCLFIVIISEIIIVTLAPINHPNLNLTDIEVKSMKKQILKIMLFLSVIFIFLIFYRKCVRCITPIIMGLGLDALFVVVAIIQKKRGEKNGKHKDQRFKVG